MAIGDIETMAVDSDVERLSSFTHILETIPPALPREAIPSFPIIAFRQPRNLQDLLVCAIISPEKAVGFWQLLLRG